MLSGNYREYLAGCETDAGPHVVKPVPTNIPYSDDCSTARELLPYSGYEAFECKEKRQILRFTFIGTGMPQCSEPLSPREYGEACFEREVMDTIVTPHTFVFGAVVTLKGSWISLGDLKISDINVVLPDGTLVAYQRRYTYFPQGTSATWLGLWTGEAPVRNCKHDRGFLKVADMFPPLS